MAFERTTPSFLCLGKLYDEQFQPPSLFLRMKRESIATQYLPHYSHTKILKLKLSFLIKKIRARVSDFSDAWVVDKLHMAVLIAKLAAISRA